MKEFDLIEIEKVQVMKALFNKVQQHIEKNNEKYAFQPNKRQKKIDVFESGDWVCMHIRKQRFF